ncbi:MULTISPECIES: hypothetical protein [unclassified Paenibacillus]|uniref:hypothetical protein n=1 Tax=unclassified Paenibacillus TaxID=185978 RepID=UPI00278481AF|nr:MULTISPECIES: hypothetical protein [unclassified Paenibacillus]MDQ0896366.1 hypothetical protein [Paenibacillus sp. V4I7]MDQ0914090.1 hypothetical protein [Paenibacillus sp. V4I5]
MALKNICLVPMAVEALPVNVAAQQQTFRRFTMDYEKLSPEPDPFITTEISPNDLGMYLHWTLPKAFRTGVESDGDYEFRTVPNRWLVVRKILGSDNPGTSYWIVESNAIHRFEDAGSPWSEHARIGLTIPSTEWGDGRWGVNYLNELTIMGPGDHTFAIFQPNCKDVFSMVDPLDRINEAEINYLIIGWYANSDQDPLNEIRTVNELKNRLSELDWEVGDNPPLTNQTFVYGQVKGIAWNRNNTSSSNPLQIPHLVSIGLTSADALNELLGAFTEDDDILAPSNLLESHMYNLLRSFEDPDGADSLDDHIHQTGFEGIPGGWIWSWSYRENENGTGNGMNVLPDPSRDSADRAVSELNKAKMKLDQKGRYVRNMRQEVYDVWWKWDGDISHDGELLSYGARLRGELDTYPGQSRTVWGMYQQFHSQYPDKQLIPVNLSRFWRPQDPAVLITGIKQTLPTREAALPPCRIAQYRRENRFPREYRGLPHGLYEAVQDLLDMGETVPWSEPWEPIFLEWEIKWFPMPFDASHWKFNGEDYTCIAKPMSGHSQKIRGRICLGAQAVGYLKDRINQFKKDLALSTNHAISFEDRLSKWKVLSQPLEGLIEQFILRDLKAHPLSARLEEILGEEAIRMKPADYAFSGQAPDFQPVIAGHLKIEKLDIIDRFGQVETVNLAAKEPLVAESLMTEPDLVGVVELKPRLAQAMRMNFNWVSAQNDLMEVHIDDQVNPVCGWILPNHLDRGLLIYSPEGKVLGEIRISGSGQEMSARWELAPDVFYRDLNHLKDTYRVLGDYLIGITSAGGSALLAFMQTIDETLWMIDPKGRSFSQTVAVYLGRPLALVRSKVFWELDTPDLPVIDPKNDFNADRDRHPYYRLELPMGIGNAEMTEDGVLGYYEGEDYSKFYAVHAYTGPDRESSPYIQVIGQPDPQDSNVESYLRIGLYQQKKYITMLLDPCAKAHIYSGLLPVKRLELPDKFRNDNKGNLEVLFQGGPILTNIITEDRLEKIYYPKPNDTLGEWNWVERFVTSTGDWKTRSFPIKPIDAKEFPVDKPVSIREGWLQLKVSHNDNDNN